MSSAATAIAGVPLAQLLSQRRVDSVVAELRKDPESDAKFPNNKPREVHEGHFVHTAPDALPHPRLVAASSFFGEQGLGLVSEDLQSNAFARVFSGELGAAHPGTEPANAWATPYAVSVFGQPIMAPDPFGTGKGYGDGRAMSIGEFQGNALRVPSDLRAPWLMNGSTPPPAPLPTTSTWELQLKGCGTTPFSRGADGRAVLRSSVREYLAMNAMHHLHVPTTLALSLVVSDSLRVDRPWYPPDYKGHARPPMVLQEEKCAITCRAAPSFIRIGHFELFARRVARGDDQARTDLARLVRHAIRREFPHIPLGDDNHDATGAQSHHDIPSEAVVEFLRCATQSLLRTVVQWVRTGYVQGNMNSDNMLISGRTLDYGPFGFMERFSPVWSPFTSDPEKKFGFMRQPLAMQVNVVTLARALVMLRPDDDNFHKEIQEVVGKEYVAALDHEMDLMRRSKLGLFERDDVKGERVEKLWDDALNAMAISHADFTLFWRLLARLATDRVKDIDDVDVLRVLAPCFYSDDDDDDDDDKDNDTSPTSPCPKLQSEATTAVCTFVRNWLELNPDAARMNQANPKYVLREWMLVQAYDAANNGDFGLVHELEALVSRPYNDDHDESVVPNAEARYFTKTPIAMRERGGVAFFS